jgi:SpoVK/Ycf46/Vps4 family AAA+-type ATPase
MGLTVPLKIRKLMREKSMMDKSKRSLIMSFDDLASEDYVGPPLDLDLIEEEDTSVAIDAIFEVALRPENEPCIVYFADTEQTLCFSSDRYQKFKKQIKNVTGKILIIGSSITREKEIMKEMSMSKSGGLLDLFVMDNIFMEQMGGAKSRGGSTRSRLLKLFPTKIYITPPNDKAMKSSWDKKIKEDMENTIITMNMDQLNEILWSNKVTATILDHSLLKTRAYTKQQLESIFGLALAYHIKNNPNTDFDPETKTLTMDEHCIQYAIKLLQHTFSEDIVTHQSLEDVVTENEFEQKLLSEVIPPHQVSVGFDDIGALDSIKGTMKELVMLPLQRPELFKRGNLTRPCKGILLFGPPGTGKTMLAKAVATESGANFIAISMSSIASKWFGEGEKYTKALFTLASKISPCIIFIDEVDCLLGRREKQGEHDAMRKIKNEFMMMWDGLKSKDSERIIVLAATNRPHDLDDAVLRRLPRRLLVDLPDAENRTKILKVILKDEDLNPDVDIEEIAKSTKGYSGSDLRNLCVAAAYRPIRELLKREEKMKKETNMDVDPVNTEKLDAGHLRALKMKDFIKAKEEISASVSDASMSISELRRWNEEYGEGGKKKATVYPYFG